MVQDLDLAILGGGTGGYVAAIRAAQLGLRVAVVERDKIGGTCLHRGCIPSKALLRSAEVLSLAKTSSRFGVNAGAPTFSLETAMERKRSIVEQLHKGVEFLLKKNHVEVIRGTGRVMGASIFSPQPGALSVTSGADDSCILAPKYTLLATGSRPRPLAGLPFDGKQILSSDHALVMEHLPASVIIVGGGAIGVEWASMLHDFGVDVTVIEFLERLLPGEDADVSAELARVFAKRKIKVKTSAQVLVETVVTTATGVQLQIRTAAGDEPLAAAAMLVATGREPCVDDIGLEATEIVLHHGAIVVDEHYQTKERAIYAIGDVIGGLQLAHVAAHEGIHAVEKMAGGSPSPVRYSNIARCTYCRPEIASIGLTEAQAVERGHDVHVGKFSFRSLGKALVLGETEGFVKVVADAGTNDLLGVHIIGPQATDLISEAGLALLLDATPWEIGHTVHPHPTLSEAIGEASLAVDGRAIHSV